MATLKQIAAALALAFAVPCEADPVTVWQAYAAEASSRFGVPIDWIEHVMRAESDGQTVLNGQPIRSRAGAMGLMQLMPGTWDMLRRSLDLGTNPDDPHDNILAGTLYLRMMYERFGYPGLFAAYNAGPGRFAEHLATGRSLPGETLAYVRKLSTQSLASAEPAKSERPDPLFVNVASPQLSRFTSPGERSLAALFAVRNDAP